MLEAVFWYVIHSLFTSVLSGGYSMYKLNLLTATKKSSLLKQVWTWQCKPWLAKTKICHSSQTQQKSNAQTSKGKVWYTTLWSFFQKQRNKFPCRPNYHADCFTLLLNYFLFLCSPLSSSCTDSRLSQSTIYTLASSDITIAQGVYQYLQAENLFSTGVFPRDRKENLLGYI